MTSQAVTSEAVVEGERRSSLPWYLALPTAALGGFALDLATPEPAWWPAMFIGVALVLAAVWQQGIGLGTLAGLVAGTAFWLPNISWLTLYLGPVPWLGLSGVMILWYALFGLCAAVATRGLARTLGGLALTLRGLALTPRGRTALLILSQSLAAAGLWVLREQAQGFWPYGGFAWGRLAHTQAEGPLAPLVSWVGFSGLTGLLALACAIPVAVAFAVRRSRAGGARRAAKAVAISTAIAAAGVVAALALLSLVPPAALEQTGTLRVGAVQGNSKSGIFDDRENGDVFRVHLEQTEEMLDRLEAEGESVDVIVWPENSAEFELPEQVYRALAVQRLAERAGAPIVVGTILRDDIDTGDGGAEADATYTNSTLVFDAEGDTGARYDKRRPVPFAEYMPNRAFYRALAPDLVDLVQLEYQHGTRSSVMEIEGASGPFSAALAICFDIIFDDHAVAMMHDGASEGLTPGSAEVIFAQTNNADFGRTEESAQQLQIARLRAVETGRALVNISTVGTSAIVLPDGSDAARLPTHTADSMVAEVPLVTGLTPALRFGGVIAAIWMLLGAAGVGAGAVVGILSARRSHGRP